MRRAGAGVAAALAAGLASTARADDAPQPNPPPAAEAAICTDRPTKSNFACVAPLGRLQVEADVVNFTRQRSGGVSTDVWLATNPTFKAGLVEDVDVEANLAPYVVVRAHGPGGADTTTGGIGDLYLRLKWNYLDSDDHRWSFAMLPYVKAPTARRAVGNGAVEGGVLFPINFEITPKLTLTTVPEFDALKNGAGAGRHFSSTQLVNVGYALGHGVTVYGELWGQWSHDPGGTVRQASADLAVAWAVTPRLQLDAGVNVGLNRATPDAQLYLGVSRVF